MNDTVLTIGHSTHMQHGFISLLRQQGVTALCDVRSRPYSRMNPQFNREELRESLRECGIRYVFMGHELGGRSEDEACYDGGKVRYDRIANTESFRKGLARVQKGMRDYQLALMCAEKEPLECHRAILIARYLVQIGLDVRHIHANGTLESHSEAMNRLIRKLDLQECNMFLSPDELLADAYRLQERAIAYDSGKNTRVKVAASGVTG